VEVATLRVPLDAGLTAGSDVTDSDSFGHTSAALGDTGYRPEQVDRKHSCKRAVDVTSGIAVAPLADPATNDELSPDLKGNDVLV
jgi:hypothetical protein